MTPPPEEGSYYAHPPPPPSIVGLHSLLILYTIGKKRWYYCNGTNDAMYYISFLISSSFQDFILFYFLSRSDLVRSLRIMSAS